MNWLIVGVAWALSGFPRDPRSKRAALLFKIARLDRERVIQAVDDRRRTYPSRRDQ